MRPVVKKIFLDDTGSPIKKYFEPWGKAKPELVQNLGSYCSYCEVPSPSAAIDVEHVQDKDDPRYAHLIHDWENFLLGCKNCNPVKGTKDVVFTNVHLPHLNNTMLSVRILESGLIQVNPDLTESELSRATNFVELVGLNRHPGHPRYSRKDDRWQNRKSAWEMATRYLKQYQEQSVNLQVLIDLAKGYGFFCVWMAVFQGHPVVKQALVMSFPGTDPDCFDATFSPVNRNGSEI